MVTAACQGVILTDPILPEAPQRPTEAGNSPTRWPADEYDRPPDGRRGKGFLHSALGQFALDMDNGCVVIDIIGAWLIQQMAAASSLISSTLIFAQDTGGRLTLHSHHLGDIPDGTVI